MTPALASDTRPEIGLVRASVHQPPYTLRDLVTAAFYHWRVMLVAFVVPVLLGSAAALVAKPSFVAQARLLVLYGSEYFYHPAAGQPAASVALDRNEIMLGELQVLQSTALAMETLQAVGVDRVYPGTPPGDQTALDRAALRMSHDLAVTTIPQSSVLELSFRSRDPDTAAAVLRTLITSYLERRAKIFQRSAASGTTQADQDAFLARLRQAEDALSGFADAHGIANPDQQMALLLQQRASNSQARSDTEQSVSETAAKLAAMQAQLRAIPPTVQTYAETERSQEAQVLTENLAHLEAKRRDLASRYQDSFLLVQDVDRQIAALRAELAREPARQGSAVRNGVNVVYQEAQAQEITLRAQLSGLRARLTELTATASALDDQIAALSKSARQYRDLQRNRDLLEDAYRTLVRSNEDARIADTAEHSRNANIRILQPPERPAVGADLRGVLMVGGVAVGWLAAIAALAVANALRQVFIDARDAAAGLRLPVLVAVPLRGGVGRRRRKRRPAEEVAPEWVPPEGRDIVRA